MGDPEFFTIQTVTGVLQPILVILALKILTEEGTSALLPFKAPLQNSPQKENPVLQLSLFKEILRLIRIDGGYPFLQRIEKGQPLVQ